MIDTEQVGKVVRISRNHAADVLEASCGYLEQILDINVQTEATATELVQAWQKSVDYLRGEAAKMRSPA